MKDSYKIIGDAVREFWKHEGFAENVIVFFYQKYSNDKQWEQCQELVMCNSDTDFKNVNFLYDFCEGQTDVKNIHIKTLEEVTNFYYNSNYKQKEERGELLDKADKYDRIMRELYTIKDEIIEHRRKTQSIDPYDLVGDCLDIINNHIIIIQGGDIEK